MIKIIYGEKGSGKTKQIVDMANEAALTAKGVVVYLDRTNHRMHDLNRNIRLVEARHYGIAKQEELLAFIKGMLAANFDIEKVYVDGVTRLLDCNVADLGVLYAGLEQLAAEFGLEFVITASCSLENMPDFIKKHVE